MKNNEFIFGEVSGSPVEIGTWIGKNFSRKLRRTIDSFNFIFNHDFGKTWQWLIDFSLTNFQKLIDIEIMEEMEGIVKGYNSVASDRIRYEDILALNVMFDAESFLTQKEGAANGSCTSFISTGDFTSDRDVILAHSTWWRYFTAVNFDLILKVVPDNGYSFVMQTAPGLVFSGTDFYYNEKGIMASETTLDGINTYSTNGIPIFQRLRLAIQHSDSIYSFSKRIIEGNTGGYSNDYLMGDAREKEIGLLEIATHNHVLSKKNNGYFISSNMVQFDEVRRESNIKYDNSINSDNARLFRLKELMEDEVLTIDRCKRILADHLDYSLGQDRPGKNSICGHREEEPNVDVFDRKGPYYPIGSIDGKIVTGKGALSGISHIKWGKPCSGVFESSAFLASHSEYAWTEQFLEDVGSEEWKIVSHGWKR